MFRFHDATLLHLLWVIPLLIVFYVFVFKWKRRALQRFGNLDLLAKLTFSTSRARQLWKVTLIILATMFILLSLARP